MFQAYPVKAPKKPTPQTHACRVTTKWFGFLRIRRRNNEVIDDVELSLPSYTYQSQVILKHAAASHNTHTVFSVSAVILSLVLLWIIGCLDSSADVGKTSSGDGKLAIPCWFTRSLSRPCQRCSNKSDMQLFRHSSRMSKSARATVFPSKNLSI